VFRDTPLEVILVNARSTSHPTQAQAIAQANLAGGGEAEPGPRHQPAAAGAHGADGRRARRGAPAHRAAAARAAAAAGPGAARDRRLPPPDPQRDTGTPRGARAGRAPPPAAALLAEIEKRVNDENARPKKRYISPATREEVYALYYDALRRASRTAARATSPSTRAASCTAS
jgi:periplasmic protein TonB